MPPALDHSKLKAIKEALGLPDDVTGAMPIIAAGNASMGIVLEPGTPGLAMIDELFDARRRRGRLVGAAGGARVEGVVWGLGPGVGSLLSLWRGPRRSRFLNMKTS